MHGMAPKVTKDEPQQHDDPQSDAEQRDQAAGRRDEAALRRDGVAVKRDYSARHRDDDAGERDVVSVGRDRDGYRRDHDATLRDQASAGRDHAAEVRDSLAEQRDRPTGPYPVSQRDFGQLVLARRAAAADREHSRQDRSAESLSRRVAGADRGLAGLDRAHSIDDRSAAEHDRDAASVDRGAADDERNHAVLDRRGAHGDRDNAASDRWSASLDELTGSYLRRPGLLQLERDLGRAKRNGESLVVAFADVDHLKVGNDPRGHSAGDHLLQQCVQTLQAHLRPHDLVIRYGGDEFVCVIAGLELENVAHRLADVSGLLAEGSPPGAFTFGLAQLQPDDTAYDLIDRADAALGEVRSHRSAGPA